MSHSARRTTEPDAEPVRVLGRGLRAKRGVRLTLRTLRDALGKTQVEVARESQIDQGDVSRLEGRVSLDECQVATLRRYVEALGGQLELVARFEDRSISLVGTQPAELTEETPRRSRRKTSPPKAE